MHILVTNVGSTSLKYSLYQFPDETILANGRIERIGSEKGKASWNHKGQEGSCDDQWPSHREAIHFVLEKLTETVISSVQDVDCVAFKTVIAKDRVGCELLDDDVIQAMEDYVFLAPAHNPPYIKAILLFRELLPDTPLIGLFEPAFHLTMPDYARVYPIPKTWREKYAIQRYGFHGASHRYVSERVPDLVHKPKESLSVISCHLGGSSSMCAIQAGKSIDTTMGFTPQSGLHQGTRIGELDPFVVLFLMREEKKSVDDMVYALTKESGLKGLSGISDDMRDIEEACAAGNDEARLAFESYCYGIKKMIGSYVAAMNGLDVLAFAGGIGEKSNLVRKTVCDGLGYFGIALDHEKNDACRGEETLISAPQSSVPVWVVPTNEEQIVARAAYQKIQ